MQNGWFWDSANCSLERSRAGGNHNFDRLLQSLVAYADCGLDFNGVVIDPMPRPYHFCDNIRIRERDERESAGCLMDAVNRCTIYEK